MKANAAGKLSVDVREVTLIHGSHQLVYKLKKCVQKKKCVDMGSTKYAMK